MPAKKRKPRTKTVTLWCCFQPGSDLLVEILPATLAFTQKQCEFIRDNLYPAYTNFVPVKLTGKLVK
jgi:hypothetical protein